MTSTPRPTVRLALQSLEAREVPTAALAAGVLTVRGSDLPDHIDIDSFTWDGVDYVRVNENGFTTDFLASAVRRVRVFSGGGDDDISHNVGGLNAALYGEAGDDLIYGDAGRDYINGGAGFDTLKGYGGNDILVGGPDNDKLYGGDGYDRLYGGAGNDWLNSGSKTEPAYGGPGWDTNAHIWAYSGARATDINQGVAQTCVFLA